MLLPPIPTTTTPLPLLKEKPLICYVPLRIRVGLGWGGVEGVLLPLLLLLEQEK